jgi:hypothetical protein
VDEIVVVGRRPEDAAQVFVEQIARAPRGQRLARWDREICIGAANLDPRYAQFMIDRVATRAAALGLEIEGPGCRPDVLIIGAANADALASGLVDEHPQAFRPSQNGTDFGSAALRDFRTSDAPVRWWHVSLPVSIDTGEAAIAVDGEDPPQVAVREVSRMRSNVREDLRQVIVILDTARIGRVEFGALSDYVAMVALAQIDPRADIGGYPTILDLFGSPPERPTGFTVWDEAYLRGLYEAPRDRARVSQQHRLISREMAAAYRRDRAQRAAEATP